MVNALIYGAGAIGSSIGYLLSGQEGNEGKAVEDVALLGRKGHIQKIREAGLNVSLPDGGSRTVRFAHCFSSPKELCSSKFVPDIVIVCVKAYSLPEVRAEILDSRALEGCLKGAEFVLLMNGMGNSEVLDLPAKRVYEGTTSMGAKFFEDGKVEIKGRAKTIIDDQISPGAKEFLKHRFQENGFEVDFVQDIKSQQWNKLIVNAVANPISALIRRRNDGVLVQGLEATVEDVVEECVKVASLEGLMLDKLETLKFVRSIIFKNSANVNSMLQDVLKGKRTEVDSINGYVVRLARKHGIRVPVNEALYALVKALEEGDQDK
jgi:2-dehydropantoate 2-reductase